jgi:hypothetical protein
MIKKMEKEKKFLKMEMCKKEILKMVNLMEMEL